MKILHKVLPPVCQYMAGAMLFVALQAIGEKFKLPLWMWSIKVAIALWLVKDIDTGVATRLKSFNSYMNRRK